MNTEEKVNKAKQILCDFYAPPKEEKKEKEEKDPIDTLFESILSLCNILNTTKLEVMGLQKEMRKVNEDFVKLSKRIEKLEDLEE